MTELKINFRYEHGSANTGRLDLYDASVALNGISRSLSIVTHAFLNGEVRTHGDAARGAKFYINTPKRGSFIFEATVFFGSAIAGGVFYDFVKYAFNEAVGKLDQDDNHSKSLLKRIEPTIGELPAVLESPLYDLHRPIRKEHEITLTTSRPRGEVLSVFDKETSLYLFPTTINAPHPIIGNVTKYNSLTGWGRFYDSIEERTISFNISLDSSEYQRSLITWSLHEHNLGRPGTLYFKANAVVTPNGKIKRYIVNDISNMPIK
ncbi:hypothetical protein D3C87_920970 [compost metagenome]